MISAEIGQFLAEHMHQHYADTDYFNTVENTKESIWKVKVAVDNIVIKFEVTGAEVTVISEAIWKTLNLLKPLQKQSLSLCDPDHTPMKVLGKAFILITYKGR